MQRWVAWLRGINVTGRRVGKDDLLAPFVALGAQHVATYQASGNVVFDLDGSEDDLTELVEEALDAALGFEVATFLRSADEVRGVAAHEPFDADAVAASTGKPQVVFLRTAPTTAQVRAVQNLQTDADLLHVAGRELYWLPSGGTQTSDLDWRAVGEHVGRVTTMRTHGTVQRLAARFLEA